MRSERLFFFFFFPFPFSASAYLNIALNNRSRDGEGRKWGGDDEQGANGWLKEWRHHYLTSCSGSSNQSASPSRRRGRVGIITYAAVGTFWQRFMVCAFLKIFQNDGFCWWDKFRTDNLGLLGFFKILFVGAIKSCPFKLSERRQPLSSSVASLWLSAAAFSRPSVCVIVNGPAQCTLAGGINSQGMFTHNEACS